MRLKSIELTGFKSFAKKVPLEFSAAITAIVGPNGSGKSNVAEAFRFVLGEQSMKSMRGRRGEDLIWNGTASSPRAGRAGVKLLFDNSDRGLDLDFDEVAIERVVHRSGENDYILNGSVVRLRDVAGLLTQHNIGASGHHIISQGEADRILSASARERREMLEDALGLTAYLYKREEAERKLHKSEENMREVEALRRELSPHLKFLASQVKKVEESQKLRGELREKYLEYLKREDIYLKHSQKSIAEEKDAPARDFRATEATIAHLREELASKGKTDAPARDLMELEAQGRAAAIKRELITRELGRIEGELTAHTKLKLEGGGTVPAREARDFAELILQLAEGSKLVEIMTLVRTFLQKIAQILPLGTSGELEEKKKTLEVERAELQHEEERTAKAVVALRKKIESEKDASREAERELFAAMARRSELQGVLQGLRAREELLVRESEQFKQELGEAGALIGTEVRAFESYPVVLTEEGRAVQEERRRKLERLKIRLEDIGTGAGNDILKEHQETKERDEFLARELGDLTSTKEKLKELIGELTATLHVRFGEGIKKINVEFEAFFKLMFGGGTALLAVVKEAKLRRGAPGNEDENNPRQDDGASDAADIEVEEGIDITVSLPHKRIKGLHMLSGGERALTSIALIFAMSQVNPPPFLILDETDAALDEANSRRYGDMIENLAKKSQLILITHNRETMSRAGVLYGITMGSDGASKLLSVKFEEAVAVAK